MYIKFAKKSAYYAMNMVIALVLMALTKYSSQIAPLDQFRNYDALFTPNIIHHCRKLVQIKYHGGAGTKMFSWIIISTLHEL